MTILAKQPGKRRTDSGALVIRFLWKRSSKMHFHSTGVEYGGDFEDGMFHGKGELRYQDGAVIRGKFDKGVMTERLLSFTDTLEYNESDWKYCVMPDRR